MEVKGGRRMNYGRWASKEEILSNLTKINKESKIAHGGIPITSDEENIYIEDRGSHTLIIGSTGSGKTQAMIMPSIKLSIEAGESLLVNDPKGEIYERLADKLNQEGYHTIVLDFSDPRYGNNWNPLQLPYQIYQENNHDQALKLIEDIAYYIFGEAAKNEDPFWINSAKNYFCGLCLYLFKYGKKEEINLSSIEKISYEITKSEKLSKFIEQVENSNIFIKIRGIVLAPNETKGSILSIFSDKIEKFLTRESLLNMLSKSDFDITKVRSEKTAVFIVSKGSNCSENLIPLLFNQMIDSSVQNSDKTRRLNVLLDEFDSLIPIKDFAKQLSTCRSENIKITVCIQSFVHLLNMYTKEETEILKMCFATIVYLLSEDIYTLEEIQKYCGNIEENGKLKPLISIEELKILKQFEAIVLMTRMLPFKTKLIPNYKIDWGYSEGNAKIPERETVTIDIMDV